MDIQSKFKSKKFLSIILVVVVVLVLGVYLLFFKSSAKEYSLRGIVMENRESSLVVKAYIKEGESGEEMQRFIELFITPETRFVHKVLQKPADAPATGEFVPSEDIREGSKEDLVSGGPIFAKGEAVKGNPDGVQADIIEYISIELQ